jgi:hypothetical protein
MRKTCLALGLLATLPLAADESGPTHWYLDVHSTSSSLSGYADLTGSTPLNVDLKNDLGLAANGSKVGFGLEYQGHRFGLALSADQSDFVGNHVVSEQININNTTYNAGALVNSAFTLKTYTLNWTIRCYSAEQWWAGLDLGARVIKAQLTAVGTDPLTNTTANANYSGTVPIPTLIGPSAGFNLFDNRVIVRGYYHWLGYSGVSLTEQSLDARYFPISWLGIMAFTNNVDLKVPYNSINKTTQGQLKQTLSGAGVVFRF